MDLWGYLCYAAIQGFVSSEHHGFPQRISTCLGYCLLYISHPSWVWWWLSSKLVRLFGTAQASSTRGLAAVSHVFIEETKILLLLCWAVFCECFILCLLQRLYLSCYSQKCQSDELWHAPLSKDQSSVPPTESKQKQKGKSVVSNPCLNWLYTGTTKGYIS